MGKKSRQIHILLLYHVISYQTPAIYRPKFSRQFRNILTGRPVQVPWELKG